MDWLRDHAYLAAWLALPISIISMVFQNRKGRREKLDWNRMLIYNAFLLCLAVIFTPQFDTEARTFAKIFIYGLIAFLIVDRKPRKL